ncbi:MAG: OmpA family protein [Sneathiella sp.]
MQNFKHLTSKASVIFSLLVLAGCDTEKYEELANSDLKGDPFSVELATNYKIFAKSEIDQYDWPDQQYMSIKGLSAAKGENPLPEDPQNWGISKADSIPLSNSRADLVHWLNTDARQTHPIRAAKAQGNFDCWVEQKEENWQQPHIAACQNAVQRYTPTTSQIQFLFDSAKLSQKALKKLEKITTGWRQSPGKFLLIQGHTDPTGTGAYNYKLARKRAIAVKVKLLSMGLSPKSLKVQIWGETRPRPHATKADYSVPKKQNRRVEILRF